MGRITDIYYYCLVRLIKSFLLGLSNIPPTPLQRGEKRKSPFEGGFRGM
jgi:hypothetical protein